MSRNHHRTQATQALVDAVLAGPGTTQPALRQAIQAQASTLGGHAVETHAEVPSAVVPYINKIARYAYKVTDEDVEALQQAGYSEDALYEITISAALGAGLARLYTGLAALEGDA